MTAATAATRPAYHRASTLPAAALGLDSVPFDRAAPCLGGSLDWHATIASERRRAAAQCLTCPLVIQCAMAALMRDERWGVWGGLDMDTVDGTRPKPPSRRPPPVLSAPCGTRQGYGRHWRAGEPACRACLDARAAHSHTLAQDGRTAPG